MSSNPPDGLHQFVLCFILKSHTRNSFSNPAQLDSSPIQMMPEKTLSSVCSLRTEGSEGVRELVPRTRHQRRRRDRSSSCRAVWDRRRGDPRRDEGATGSAVPTQMNTQQSAEDKSLDKVSALIPRWRQPAGRSPWPRRSWTGTRSGGRATPASCGPNTPTCQLRFGWKWRWRSPISSACPWPRLSWWFTMCFSGRRTRRSTAPAPRRRTAPSARRGLDDCTARTHLHTVCRWLHAPDVRLQRGWMGEDGAPRGMTASWVWDVG